MLTGGTGGDLGHVPAVLGLSVRLGTHLYSRWVRAVELGAQGWAAAALTELAETTRCARRVGAYPAASLAQSTAASLLRQAGRHGDALAVDGHALSLIEHPHLIELPRPTAIAETPPESPGPRGNDRERAQAALVDGLVNLAADNLGLGRYGSSRRLLERARAVPLPATRRTDPDGWHFGLRCVVRRCWVEAELALYTGDPDAALHHIGRAREHLGSARTPSVRHRIKTDLIAAAATAASGERADALARAVELGREASAAGLIPLAWAAQSLRCGLDPDDVVAAERLSRLDHVLTQRGMPFNLKSKAR